MLAVIASNHTINVAHSLKLALPKWVQGSEEILDLTLWPPKEDLHKARKTRDSLAFGVGFFIKKKKKQLFRLFKLKKKED